MILSDIIQDFNSIDNWDDRYHYLIELGKKLPPIPEEKCTPSNKISGCISQIWLIKHIIEEKEKSPRIIFEVYSDSHIIRGLLFIMLAIYSGKTADEIQKIDAMKIFLQLGLIEHLSPQRANGLSIINSTIQSQSRL
ncbi:Sulfur acceptor protein SufE [Liberibacter crescens BT-1]|uniref:Sulfur acceptor protein SufE n=1 Tax=Liberibacter crescens (strain BT-1) TaxID=1215343 RepID=L0ETF9_LIBCB|nr:SufE family protein [Liberibacter crescens]AGA64242.1 Sulfur acceptor protein SufE [Liberibacter crescens BT-1]AMC12482.1 cysteine desufuration protein SufE [Liberibacter crescens]